MELTKDKIEWKENLSACEWDALLFSLHGHPLQSAQWGDSRKFSDKVNDFRWAAFKNGAPIYLVRFEERKRLWGFIKIAWVPKGLVISDNRLEKQLKKNFFQRLRKKGYLWCVTSPWKTISNFQKYKIPHYTLWVDLTQGLELWPSLTKQFRYDVKRAEREGVIVETTEDRNDIFSFYDLCLNTSHRKNFILNVSKEQLIYLIEDKNISAVKSYLFVSRIKKGKPCAGAFIICSGDTIHYMWGAVDRNFSKQRVGEALHWFIINWAIKHNFKRYDLGGVWPNKNDGNYNFKKKLGGTLVSLESEKIYPLKFFLKGTGRLIKLFLVLKFKFKVYKELLSHHKKSA